MKVKFLFLKNLFLKNKNAFCNHFCFSILKTENKSVFYKVYFYFYFLILFKSGLGPGSDSGSSQKPGSAPGPWGGDLGPGLVVI